MCTPNFQGMVGAKTLSETNQEAYNNRMPTDNRWYPGQGSNQLQIPYNKPTGPSPLEQAAKQYGFKEVTAPLLAAPTRPPKQVAQIVNNSAFDTKYIVGADGVSRQAKTGLASLRIDRTGANT